MSGWLVVDHLLAELIEFMHEQEFAIAFNHGGNGYVWCPFHPDSSLLTENQHPFWHNPTPLILYPTAAMRILIVEDNRDILANLVDFLEMKGYTVDCAQDGIAGQKLAQSEHYDLAIFDVMLPGMDGFTLCQHLRESQNHLPVIMLTARDTLDDRLQGFSAGADDYLVKPFELSELAARVEAVLRRTRGASRVLTVADLSLDLDTLGVTRQGKAIRLNPIGLKLLEELMRRSPGVVRRDQLEAAVWGDDCPDSDSLRSHIHQLRQLIDKPFDRPLLQTVHGIGFRLAP